MEASREERVTQAVPEMKITGSNHFDSFLDASEIEQEILRCQTGTKQLSLSFNQGGVRRELELEALRDYSTELDAGRLYDFITAEPGTQVYKVVSIFIPSSGGKAIISIPW